MPAMSFKNVSYSYVDGNESFLALEDIDLEIADGEFVCLIGHSPFLDRWAQAWTGTAVDFKPGSMALFDFDVHGGRIGSASLLFYAHPKALKFLGPSYKE